MTHRIVVIIPVRMASSRFPGKPLAEIAGLPMVEHVRRRALLQSSVHDVVVATCDSEIVDAVERHGGRALMTSPEHARGTERVEEAARSMDADIIVNVQGDEPLLMPEAIEMVTQPLVKQDAIICTNLLSPLSGQQDLADPDIVKAFVDQQGFIMGFARSMLPRTPTVSDYPAYRQTGISAFRKSFLHRFAALPTTPMERAESVDMWRVVEHGYRILGVVYPTQTLGVDHAEDIAKVEAVLRENPIQQAIHAAVLAAGGERRRVDVTEDDQ